MLRNTLILAALATASLVAPRAFAIDYTAGGANTFVGNTVEFTQVNDDDGLYGDLGGNLPTVTGDTLNLTPVGYEASCLNCGVSVMIDDTLRVTIQAMQGQSIPAVKITESGSTTLAANGGMAFSALFAPVFIDIFEVDGQGVNNVNANAVMTFTPSDTFGTDGVTNWTGMLDIDLGVILSGVPLPGQVTLMSLTLDNTLTAFASGGGTAVIEKTGLSVTVIPEPSTGLLLALGLLGLRRRGRTSR